MTDGGNSGRRAFVSGATGFLGRHLCTRLVADGWQVTALAQPHETCDWLNQPGVEVLVGDILDLGSLLAGMPAQMDAVFHLAADTSMHKRDAARQMRINIDGTRNMVAAALNKKAKRFIHTSSWHSFGFDQGPLDESKPLRGLLSPLAYDRTKFFSELVIREANRNGLSATILNPANIIGAYDPHNWGRFIARIMRRQLWAIPPGASSFVDAPSVARAHIAAVDHGGAGKNYLLGGHAASFADIVQIVCTIAKVSPPKVKLSKGLFKAAAHVNQLVNKVLPLDPDFTPYTIRIMLTDGTVTSTRAAKDLGFQPASLDDMFQDAICWLKADGWV